MRLILYTQYYRARTPERQAELDHCLRSNLQHPALDQVVLLREPDAPELPGPARMPVQQVVEAERLTYARWMQMLRNEPDAIGILINSDIALGEGWQQLGAVLNTPQSVVALSRYNPQGPGQPARLNRFPHWTQDTWALRSDAPLPDSLLYTSAFPIGFPGCDNRIAYVFWSHGLQVKNPCYHLETLHHQVEVARDYDKNGDRLYGGTSYVHPALSLGEPSELEHTIWTRGCEPCPGVLVNQQAVDRGVHQLLAQDGHLAQVFKEHHKSTGLAWANPPVGCARSAHASTWPFPALMQPPGVVLDLGGQRAVKGLQLRLPSTVPGKWQLELEGRRQAGGSWELLDLGTAAEIQSDGRRRFLEAKVLQVPWFQLKLRLAGHPHSKAEPPDRTHLLEVLVFAEKAKEESPPVAHHATTDTGTAPRPLKLRLLDKRLELVKALQAQDWTELHRYSRRFSLQAGKGRIAFVDRFWPSALTFRDPELGEWDGEALREAFVWGFSNPVLEWRPNQFAPEKQHAEQLNFWQYPCRTEQDAFERHQGIDLPYQDSSGLHVYVGMPWATWIDKKTFPEQLLGAFHSRLEAVRELLGKPLQVHSVCQHIRWKEHTHRFEQAGVNHLWIAHKEKGWDKELGLSLQSWPLYAVNILDPERRDGIRLLPVHEKTIFASFKGAHMKHYPTDIRKRLTSLAPLPGYEVEVTDLWHFNKVVYNFQIANKQSDKDAVEKDSIKSYNQLLSQSLFSLCPAGSGPNTLRLWESLGIGSIPVVLSDRYEFPSLERMGLPGMDWGQAVIEHAEGALPQLDSRLRATSSVQRQAMQDLGQQFFKASRSLTCFG
ncbi:exostosin domain-containing protein [Aphanothece minutissima]|uniref:Exostosin GT47 domain-containing protein n=1 Tax=Aphanothece cf. minutissima CCALA 015 TaxID=2107695 RepID=A0ABX5F531_9CHRO|nr:exostosin family protein [Aphanothece minutissima]PSB36504.1 hypothetical protein C7B81_13075 [Aphanothece cf. minutissima CCALA 015]